MEIKFKKDQRVWWNDPAGETSDYYTIVSDIQKEIEKYIKNGYDDEGIRDALIIRLCNESGSEVEAPVWELESIMNESIKPDAGMIISPEDDTLSGGDCPDSSKGFLSDKTELVRKIEKCYEENFNAENPNEETPKYASCRIAYFYQDRDEINECFDTIIKLDMGVMEPEDDDVYYFCNGIDDFKSLVELGIAGFVVIDIYDFTMSAR